MDRKAFIQTTALASGAVLMPAWLRAKPNTDVNRVQVVIIGAGLSGLAAAYQLHKRGISFVVLESRGRVGGRVFSHKMTKDLIIELGGEWVGNSHTRIQQLCREFGLELENNQLETHLIYKDLYSPAGKWDYSANWKVKLNTLLKEYAQLSDADKVELDQYDWWRYLINNGCQGKDLEIRALLDSTDFGESIRHVSAFAALSEYAESSPKNEMDLKIKGGNARLPEAIMQQIGIEKVLLKHSVSKIIQGDKIQVQCGNGASFIGDSVICTVPAFALCEIEFEPLLPLDTKAALRQLQYARINKQALHFKERFWKAENFDLITDQSPQYFYHGTKNQQGKEGVIIAYSIGDKAAMNNNYAATNSVADVFRCLEPHFGNIKSLYMEQVNYYWGNDNLSHGAYALYGIGQWYSIRPILQKPFGAVHFAGEHLADWQGFMEGAINSGEDAAAAIEL